MHSIELSFKQEEITSLRAEVDREREKNDAQEDELACLAGVVEELKVSKGAVCEKWGSYLASSVAA